MLRGNTLAKLDGKGRLKLPSKYRTIILPTWGTEFFITSIDGASVLIYPLPVYQAIEEKLFRSSKVEPGIRRLNRAYNYFGQPAAMDAQGRVLIHPLLRESAKIEGEVAVLGQIDHLEVWNHASISKEFRDDPITEKALSEIARQYEI